MASGVGFEGANRVYQAPPGDTNCVDLETYANGEQVISCWRLSEDEIAEVVRTGVVWVSVPGDSIYPMHVSGEALLTINDQPAKAEPVMPRKAIKDRKTNAT